MQAFPEFRHMPMAFWAMIKYVSETLGYTVRGQGIVRTYTIDEIDSLLSQNGIVVDYNTIEMAKLYFDMRADLLNNVVQHNLMNAREAKEAFEELLPIHRDNDFKCKLPMNKQKGEMRQVAFFTAIINIVAEDTIAILLSMMALLDLMMIPEDWCMYLMMKTTLSEHLPDDLMVHIPTSSIQELYGKSRNTTMLQPLAAVLPMEFMKLN